MSPAHKIVLLLSLLITFGDASACFKAKRGYGWSADELIEYAESIVLVVMEGKETHGQFMTIIRLRTIEVLKGEDPKSIEFISYTEVHHGKDFAGHADKEFWKKGVGRSPFPCCICGPDHTFAEGETYLVFPDGFGAMKSAEIVSSSDDRWLQYVRESLKTN